MQIIDWALIILYMIIMVVVGAYFKTSSSMSVLLLHRYCAENGAFDSDNSSSGEYGYFAHGGAQQASG